MVSRFRVNDRVLITAADDFYAFVDGWRGRVAVVGPKPANACHHSVAEGFALVEIEREGVMQHYPVPVDQLELTV